MSVTEDQQSPGEAKSAAIGELTHVVIGRRMSMTALNELLDSVGGAEKGTWVGSVGYENHRDVDQFARLLADAGVEKLIDVRELPISRRRGFAKTALSNALAGAGVEYLHLKVMGNPKEFRDLYKSGQVEAGRDAYQRFLLSERRGARRRQEGMRTARPASPLPTLSLRCVQVRKEAIPTPVHSRAR